MLPGQRAVASHLDVLYPILRCIGTVFIVALGMMLCGMIGSLAYPVGGVGAILGSGLGAVISLVFGCCLTGFWKDVLPDDNRTFGVGALLPHALAVQIGGHGNFDLILTVHEAVGVEVQGRMPWQRADTYIEVECGNNPVKRTCVKSDGKFNEQFKLQVAGSDQAMVLRIKDQDVFGARDVGFVYVDIQKDIIGEGFPWRKEFMIEAGENDRLRWGKNKAFIVLSFDYTEEYPHALRSEASRSMKSRQEQEKQWASKGYGAVSFLSQLEFNTQAKIAKEDDHFRTKVVHDAA